MWHWQRRGPCVSCTSDTRAGKCVAMQSCRIVFAQLSNVAGTESQFGSTTVVAAWPPGMTNALRYSNWSRALEMSTRGKCVGGVEPNTHQVDHDDSAIQSL